jgi:hypothetical protein
VNGAKELHELLSGARGKCVYGVSNNIRVDMFGKIETNGDTPWAGIL